ncbi:helix-turn-helix domain-containing protein [Pectinatus frisingensis]|uniref:helix-turn-helix domain-containing protein n=1 Tax=Pectinatus frisingensis TaxID=865 RepID=UPI0018C5D86B|nr:helix-turn-helix transcriptional regulator [Pectinatus frisingensis]
MQKKCRRCGELFTPVDGEFYCEKCGGTAAVVMPNEKPEITAPEELPPEIKKYTLREAREKAGFPQNTIAKQLGMSQGSYNNMERGNYMSIDRVKRFSGIVNIPPEQIKCREPKPPVRPSCVTKHKNPAGFTPKPVPEVKQAVNELVEPVNKAFPQDNSQPTDTTNKQFPQDSEENEYRYLNAAWLNEIAIGLTAGIKKHPGETWHDIPANEHLARAFRHINLMRMGDRSDNHIINASMRLMMAYVVDRNK